jgi:hypothetical protein
MTDDVQQLMAGRPEYAPENDPEVLRARIRSLKYYVWYLEQEVDRLEDTVIATVNASFEDISNA